MGERRLCAGPERMVEAKVVVLPVTTSNAVRG